jgi:hypothetical protein
VEALEDRVQVMPVDGLAQAVDNLHGLDFHEHGCLLDPIPRYRILNEPKLRIA